MTDHQHPEPAGPAPQAKPLTSTERIYQAVLELRALDQPATRDTVAELTGLKLSIVDDRLRALVDDGRLRRILRGIYEVVEVYPPPRPMSCTLIGVGRVKFEIGDMLVELTPTEARNAARALGGFAEDARVIASTREHLFVATELTAKVERLERVVNKIRSDGETDAAR